MKLNKAIAKLTKETFSVVSKSGEVHEKQSTKKLVCAVIHEGYDEGETVTWFTKLENAKPLEWLMSECERWYVVKI